MRRRASKRALRTQIAFMRRHMLEMADVIDELRLECDQLRARGDLLVRAVDTNDGTIDAAWRLGDAVSVWQEYGGQ